MKHKLLFVIAAMMFFAIGSPAYAQHCDTRKGDSMWKIAKRYKVPFAKILILNKHYPNQNLIHPQDDIQLPEGEHGQSTEDANSETGTETAERTNGIVAESRAYELTLRRNPNLVLAELGEKTPLIRWCFSCHYATFLRNCIEYRVSHMRYLLSLSTLLFIHNTSGSRRSNAAVFLI